MANKLARFNPIDGNEVSIRASVKRNEEDKAESMRYSECHRGEQYRSFSLPQKVDDTKAMAKYHDGILELTLPKKDGGHCKQLTIQ